MATADSLLGEVQRDLIDGKPLADLLRKCILLGSQSGSSDLRAWATRELRGYEDETDLPDYRKVMASIKVDAIAGRSWVTGQEVSATSLPEFAQEYITNEVSIFQGIGQLEALYAESKSSGENPRISLPGWDVIGREIDRLSGNPFQHTSALYWVIGSSSIAGILDDVRTVLTELLAELGALMPAHQAVPTAEQANQALTVAVHGGSANLHIATSINAATASGGSTIQSAHGGTAAAAAHDVTQTITYAGAQRAAVGAWLRDYRAALGELDAGLQAVAAQQLDQVAVEIEKPEPQNAVVTGLLGSLRLFAQNAVTAAGAGAGTMGLTEVLAHWPLH